MKISRGLRNNNPLNIRRNGTAWKGLSAKQSDKEFFTFDSPAWGYRAALITLRNYKRLHGLSTIREWVSRWAPPVENDTENYVNFVSRNVGLPAESSIDTDNKELMCKIVSAMSHMENGVRANAKDIEDAWELI